MVILHLTEVLPAPIPAKRHENNALLVSIQHHVSSYPNAKHLAVLLIPYVSVIGAFFSANRKQYYQLRRQKKYTFNGFEVQVIPVLASGYALPFLRPLLDLGSWWLQKKQLSRLIREHQIKLTHAHNVYNAANLAKHIYHKENIPYVISTRNIPQFFTSNNIKANLTNASALISLNHRHKVLAEQLAPGQPSFLIPHGLDTSFFDHAKNTLTKRDPSTALRLVSVCRLVPLKNIDKILYSLQRAKTTFHYDIYGEGPELIHLKNIAEKLNINDRVVFHGHIDHSNVAEVLSASDIFIMPSFPETLGRVFFEAMSLGLPIIAAKHSGIDGYIQHGISGFLINHEIPDELDNTLNLLSQNPTLRQEVGKNAQQLVLQFSWAKIVSELHQVYNLCLQKNKV